MPQEHTDSRGAESDPHIVLVVHKGGRSDSPMAGFSAPAHRVVWRTACDLSSLALVAATVVVLEDLEAAEIARWCAVLPDLPQRPIVLVLTHSRAVQIHAFQVGADDCLCAEMDQATVWERVFANSIRGQVQPVRTVGRAIPTPQGPLGLSFCPTVSLAGAPLELPRIQSRLLQKLLESARPVSVQELSAGAWPNEVVAVHTVHTQIALLKARLSTLGVTLRHIRGLGYALGIQRAAG